MSTHKNFDKICVAVLVLTLLLTLLFMGGERLGITVVVDEDDEAHSGSVFFTANDLNGDWDTSGATVITLDGDGASVSGGGAYAHDGNVVISSAGLYLFSGRLTDGSIVVDAHNNSKVWLLFDGVELSCSDDACLRVEQAEKVFLTLAEGSANRMTGPVIFSAAAEADGTDGVIYAHDDLTINGSGSLTLISYYRHGIVAKDDLVITGGTIEVKAQADGIRASDSLRICRAAIRVEANDDGIVARGDDSRAAASDNGYVYIESGSLALSAEDDALCAVGSLTIAGGEFSIFAVGDAIRSDCSVDIAGGTVKIDECYEGVEAPLIRLSGGDTTILCRDDGLNASESLYDYSLTPQVLISGGSLTIVNETAVDADGIDSNGDILISGGTVRVSLPGSGTNNAIDYDSEGGGVCEISGGRVIACGGYTMAKGFSASSAQCSVLYNIASGVSAGTALSLEDSGGNTLVSWEVPCAFSSVTLSVPELQIGESYLMVLGENVEAIELEETSASYGSAQSSAFGGSMNWGRMQPRGDFGGFGAPPSGEGAPPEAPEGAAFGGEGDRPEPPEGGFGGEPPAPPEGGFAGEMPAAAQPPGLVQSASTAASVRTASPVSTEVWLLIGAAALVLLLGILLGFKYEPKD